MKKALKATLICIFALPLLICTAFAVYYFTVDEGEINHEALDKGTLSVSFYDDLGQAIPVSYALGERTAADQLPQHLINAFVAIEDRRFFEHGGVDYRGIARAFFNNLKSLSLKEGASTITQQLIKNTHLSPQKTLERKIKEIKLAKKLEKRYEKKQILNFYLNGIYFGEGVYGIENAARNYFSLGAEELNIAQSAALAATVQAPAIYNPRKPKCVQRRNLVLKQMLAQGYITQAEYADALAEEVRTTTPKRCDYLALALEEAFELTGLSPYSGGKLEIHTFFSKEANDALEQALEQYKNASAVVMSADGKIKACLGNSEDCRCPASTVKPLLVYAPAIDSREISLCTKVLDEQCSFGDYSPKNYGNKYYGWVSVRQALCDSLNVPAVKIFNTIGTEKARLYARKMDIDLKDEGLGVALGGLSEGLSLVNICGGYTALAGSGCYFAPSFVKAVYRDGKEIFTHSESPVRVFKEGTSALIRDALESAVSQGTAKALRGKNYQICAKTGTAGSSDGNTDAYTVCYTSEDVIGVRFSSEDGKLMPNEITGGWVAKYASSIADELYKSHSPRPFEPCDQLTEVQLCKLAYEKGVLAKALPSQPERYTLKEIMFKEVADKLPLTYFCMPAIEDYSISVESDHVIISVTKQANVNIKIDCTFEGNTVTLYQGSEDVFCHTPDEPGIYAYSITPYFSSEDGDIICGESILLPAVKIQPSVCDDFDNLDWWED